MQPFICPLSVDRYFLKKLQASNMVALGWLGEGGGDKKRPRGSFATLVIGRSPVTMR